MDREQLRLLKKIMEVEFAVLELNLYLNTHPRDESALEDFNQYVRQLRNLKQEYRDQYGPLSARCPSGYPWQYPAMEWPWQINY